MNSSFKPTLPLYLQVRDWPNKILTLFSIINSILKGFLTGTIFIFEWILFQGFFRFIVWFGLGIFFSSWNWLGQRNFCSSYRLRRSFLSIPPISPTVPILVNGSCPCTYVPDVDLISLGVDGEAAHHTGTWSTNPWVVQLDRKIAFGFSPSDR